MVFTRIPEELINDVVVPIKIGMTTRDVQQRIKEQTHTGHPHDMQIVMTLQVIDVKKVEHEIHNALAGIRISKDREWFQLSLNQLRQVVQKYQRQ